MTAAIAGIGVAVPTGRADATALPAGRGVETVAVPAADEDALTLAVEAAERALRAADVPAADVDFLGLATTTPPLAEGELTVRLGSALGVGPAATRHVFTGSTRAGTRALDRAVASGETGLVVAADVVRRAGDDGATYPVGAGAAALVLASDGGLTIDDRAEHAEAYPGTRFRRPGRTHVEGVDVREYDRRAFLEPIARAVEGLDTGSIDGAAIQAPDGDLPERAADRVGVGGRLAPCSVVERLGDAGAASPLLGLAEGIEAGAERLLVASWGGGAAADALVLAGSCPVDQPGRATRTVTADAARRAVSSPDQPAGGGAAVSQPAWRRSLPQRHRLVAGRCPDCGALAFPPRGACRSCRGRVEFESVELPPTGTVERATAVAGRATAPEFAPLVARGGEVRTATVAFTVDGASVSVPMQAVAAGPAPEAGDTVETVLRHLYTHRGVPRYCRKARRV